MHLRLLPAILRTCTTAALCADQNPVLAFSAHTGPALQSLTGAAVASDGSIFFAGPSVEINGPYDLFLGKLAPDGSKLLCSMLLPNFAHWQHRHYAASTRWHSPDSWIHEIAAIPPRATNSATFRARHLFLPAPRRSLHQRDSPFHLSPGQHRGALNDRGNRWFNLSCCSRIELRRQGLIFHLDPVGSPVLSTFRLRCAPHSPGGRLRRCGSRRRRASSRLSNPHSLNPGTAV